MVKWITRDVRRIPPLEEGVIIFDTVAGHKHDGTLARHNFGVTPITQAFGDVASEGTSAASARADHKHGMPANPATREFFLPFTYGTEIGIGYYTLGAIVDADGERGDLEFYVPDDFTSITEAHIVWEALAAVTNMSFKVSMRGGAHGEAGNTLAPADITITRTTSAYYIYEDDISTLLTGIASGDYLRINPYRPSGGNTNACFIGIHFKYT